jgi:solute carrier family 25 S-adenosylmethionine transporter 26
MVEALQHAVRESPLGLYRGFFAMVAREIPFSGIQFPVYEGVRKLTQGNRVAGENSTVGSMGCGAVAGGTAAFLTTPFDFIKTRIILEETAEGSVRRSALEIASDAVKKDGVTVLWSGATARTALISVGGCVFFGAYETSTAFLQNRSWGWLH